MAHSILIIQFNYISFTISLFSLSLFHFQKPNPYGRKNSRNPNPENPDSLIWETFAQNDLRGLQPIIRVILYPQYK